jgi:hypothetical protein
MTRRVTSKNIDNTPFGFLYNVRAHQEQNPLRGNAYLSAPPLRVTGRLGFPVALLFGVSFSHPLSRCPVFE